MRNPNWHRDEIILALELYFSPDRGSIDKNNPKIIQLSKTLRSLPLFVERKDELKFRNANGVAYKLANFRSFDPSYNGKGASHGSDLDEEVLNEFVNDKERLKAIAHEIKNVASNDELKQKISSIEEDDLTNVDAVVEGQILYKLHKVRERDKKIIDKKKKKAIRLHGKLICEVCGFVFENYYGDIGSGFIECHHKVPLSQLSCSAITRLEDLALVCSNC